MKLKYVDPKKLKIITGMFFVTGAVGILMGLTYSEFYITMLGTINICLGGLTGWLLLTQAPKVRDARKKRRSGDRQ